MPSIDQFMAQRSNVSMPTAPSGIDSFMASRSRPVKTANFDRFIKPAVRLMDSLSVPFGQRAKTAAIGGLPAAAAGIKPEQAAETADLVGPAVASTAGAMFGGRPGMVAGAAGSRAVNEAGKKLFGLPQTQPRKLFGIGPVAPGPVNDVLAEGAGTYVGDKLLSGVGKVARGVAPQMKDKAVRMAQKILKPGGALKPKAEKIAEDSLKYDVLRGDLSKTTDMIEGKLGDLDNQLTNLLDQYKNARMSGDDVIQAFDELEAGYAKSASPERASQIASLRDDFIKAHQLEMPVYGEVERGGFVMGPASKQVNPQLKTTYSSQIKGPLKGLKDKVRYDSVRKESGKFGRSEPKREVFTPAKSVENPDDIVALNIPKRGGASTQKIVSATPKETYSIRPETRGVGTKTTEVIGKTPRQIPVGEAQNLKRDQYALLKEMRSEGGYNVQTKSPEIKGRQAAARAYKEGVAKNVPGASDVNEKMSDLINVGDAANARLPVAERNNFFDLGDLALASGGKMGLATVRKLFGAGQAKIARGLYKGSKPVANFGKKLASPTVRALSQIPSRLLTSQFTEN